MTLAAARARKRLVRELRKRVLAELLEALFRPVRAYNATDVTLSVVAG
jgi:hypothetical protein